MLKYLAWVLVVSAQKSGGQIQDRQIRLATNGEGKAAPGGKGSTNGQTTAPVSNYNSNSYGEPVPLKQNSLSAGLFKNGYAFYVHQCEVNGDGLYLLDIPSTVHGTLSVSSPDKDVTLSTQFETVSVEAPLDTSSLSKYKIQNTFAGKQVVLQLEDSTISGTVAKLTEPEQSSTSPSSMSEAYNPYMSTPDFLVLEDEQGGLTLVDPTNIISFKVQGAAKVMKDDKRLTILVQGSKGPSAIQVSYLSYGVTWAPSYYVDISDASALSLSFQVQIRNQARALNASDVQLITGFPNLQFQSVTSLLSSDLNTFVREVNNVGNSPSRSGAGIMSQSIMSNSAYGMTQDIETNKVESDGSDVLYTSIGPLALKPKAAVLKNVAVASAPFQQVVDWDASEEDAWDAIRFTNPLSSAITTAPVSVVQNGRLLGQSSTKWTPPKGLAIVRTSKALSIRVWKSESQGEEQPLAPARAKLVQVNVEGVLNVVNSRSTNVTMCLNYGFDGVLVPVRGNGPKVSTVEGGSGGLNPRTNVNWEFFMAAGAKTNVTFYYNFKKRVYY